MGRKRTPGLLRRGGAWHIDKVINGRRLCESCGTSDLQEAEGYLARRIEEVRQASIYGTRPRRLWHQAATKYLQENQHKASLADDALHLKRLHEFIGHLAIEAVHIGSLQRYIKTERERGLKAKSINLGLGTVRHILNLAASEWLDENGLTWLPNAPKIRMLQVDDARKPYPLSWEEQSRLFKELPSHLAQMALYKVNTGCRQEEVCHLKWEWEVHVPELETSVFIIPEGKVKNREERLVVLNDVARSVVDGVRGQHATFVFTYKGRSVRRINNSAWRRARSRSRSQIAVSSTPSSFWRISRW